MATLSSVQMGSQQTPSVRIPRGAVPRPGPPPPAPSPPRRAASRRGREGTRTVLASEQAWRRGAGSRSLEAQSTQPPLPPGPGAPPARPSVSRAGSRFPQPCVPGARAARGRGGGGGCCTHHSRPSSPARSAGADGADAGLGFHINFFLPRAPLFWSSAPPSAPRLPSSTPSLVTAALFVFLVVVFFFVLVFVFSSSSVFTKGTESVKTPARWAAGGFRRSAARTHNYKPVSIKQFHGPRRGWSAAP